MNKNNLNNQAIPTLDEIQKVYEDVLRSKASEENESNLESGEFFKAFRKYEKGNKKINKENSILKKYGDYIKFEKNKHKENIEELENLIEYEKFFLEYERI